MHIYDFTKENSIEYRSKVKILNEVQGHERLTISTRFIIPSLIAQYILKLSFKIYHIEVKKKKGRDGDRERERHGGEGERERDELRLKYFG